MGEPPNRLTLPAAERLNVSQPPLSRHIKSLEGLLRIKLFERDTHSVSLTSAGEAFEPEISARLTISLQIVWRSIEARAEVLRVVDSLQQTAEVV